MFPVKNLLYLMFCSIIDTHSRKGKGYVYDKYEKERALRSALAITICTVTIASVNTPVYSAPSTDELESTTSGLKGELNDLNSQLSSLSKELDNTSSQIEDLSAKVEKSKAGSRFCAA